MGPMAQFCCCDKRQQHACLKKKSCSALVTGRSVQLPSICHKMTIYFLSVTVQKVWLLSFQNGCVANIPVQHNEWGHLQGSPIEQLHANPSSASIVINTELLLCGNFRRYCHICMNTFCVLNYSSVQGGLLILERAKKSL